MPECEDLSQTKIIARIADNMKKRMTINPYILKPKTRAPGAIEIFSGDMQRRAIRKVL